MTVLIPHLVDLSLGGRDSPSGFDYKPTDAVPDTSGFNAGGDAGYGGFGGKSGERDADGGGF